MAKVLMQPSASFLRPSSAASSITTLPRWREHQNGAIVVVLAGDDACSSRFLALAAAADGPLAGVDEARVHVEKPRSRPLADLLRLSGVTRIASAWRAGATMTNGALALLGGGSRAGDPACPGHNHGGMAGGKLQADG